MGNCDSRQKATDDVKPTGDMHDYQDLKCFECGAQVGGAMAICINASLTPTRSDLLGRDGYTALCPAHSEFVGKNDTYKTLAKLPVVPKFPTGLPVVVTFAGLKLPEVEALSSPSSSKTCLTTMDITEDDVLLDYSKHDWGDLNPEVLNTPEVPYKTLPFPIQFGPKVEALRKFSDTMDMWTMNEASQGKAKTHQGGRDGPTQTRKTISQRGAPMHRAKSATVITNSMSPATRKPRQSEGRALQGFESKSTKPSSPGASLRPMGLPRTTPTNTSRSMPTIQSPKSPMVSMNMVPHQNMPTIQSPQSPMVSMNMVPHQNGQPPLFKSKSMYVPSPPRPQSPQPPQSPLMFAQPRPQTSMSLHQQPMGTSLGSPKMGQSSQPMRSSLGSGSLQLQPSGFNSKIAWTNSLVDRADHRLIGA